MVNATVGGGEMWRRVGVMEGRIASYSKKLDDGVEPDIRVQMNASIGDIRDHTQRFSATLDRVAAEKIIATKLVNS